MIGEKLRRISARFVAVTAARLLIVCNKGSEKHWGLRLVCCCRRGIAICLFHSVLQCKLHVDLSAICKNALKF